MSNINEFVIRNGVLEQYRGRDTNVVIPDGVTAIGYGAFYDCSSLRSIVIPDSVTEIGYKAFDGCKMLTAYNDNGFIIINGILIGYTGMDNDVVIPDGVTKIGNEAFRDCSSLSSVAIPDSVTEIGYCAFSGCKNLIIHAPSGSYAETYAMLNSKKFQAI